MSTAPLEDDREPWPDDEPAVASAFAEHLDDICEQVDGMPYGAARVIVADAMLDLHHDHGLMDSDYGIERHVVYGEDLEGARQYMPSERTIALAVLSNRERTVHSVDGNTLTPEQWAKVLSVYDNQCAYCGTFGRMSLDHIVPVKHGGGTTLANCVPSCRHCNSSKGTKALADWIERKGLDAAAIYDRIDTANRRLRATLTARSHHVHP